jgi:hypothetical protein
MNRRTLTRSFLAAAIIALPTVSAYSQGATGGKKHRGQEQKTTAGKKTDDTAYKAALDRIPVPDKKYDPWQNVRGPSAH